MKNIILTQQEIDHKTRRIAYQIYETFPDDTEVVLAGIANNGYLFAQKLAAEVEKISDIKVTLCEVRINKQQPLEPVQTSLTTEEYANKSLVLIDDVLNSGRTLAYGLGVFLNIPLLQFSLRH